MLAPRNSATLQVLVAMAVIFIEVALHVSVVWGMQAACCRVRSFVYDCGGDWGPGEPLHTVHLKCSYMPWQAKPVPAPGPGDHQRWNTS